MNTFSAKWSSLILLQVDQHSNQCVLQYLPYRVAQLLLRWLFTQAIPLIPTNDSPILYPFHITTNNHKHIHWFSPLSVSLFSRTLNACHPPQFENLKYRAWANVWERSYIALPVGRASTSSALFTPWNQQTYRIPYSFQINIRPMTHKWHEQQTLTTPKDGPKFISFEEKRIQTIFLWFMHDEV
jgi:hypothetical protein